MLDPQPQVVATTQGCDTIGCGFVDEPPDRRGYKTSFGADLETGFRRLVRFQVKIILVVLILLVVVAGIVAGVVSYQRSRTVVVPDLKGVDHVGAAIVLDRAGLSPEYISLEKASTTVPIGRVISTEPPAGGEVTRETLVKVTFSCGPPQPGFCHP